ncbi:MAG: acyl-CoA dehydrogenase [Sphingomonadales bacterium]|nr:MAG: acyl-CoA dehydrogenase [Sphingomonadales bacterium]
MTIEDREAFIYRAQVRAWIEGNADDPRTLPAEQRHTGAPAHFAMARAWQARKAEAGYACIAWPREWGGTGGTAVQQAIFQQEEARANLNFTYFMVGLGICLPAVIQHGDAAMRDRFVEPAIRGEDLWCQLFSEPSGGSDVAGARTRAVRDGADWIVDGQKVWTSSAHHADYGLLLARTDPSVAKHAGLSMFWIDMRSPGIDIRPLRQMSGGSEFNEVFLSGVRVPDSQRVGAIGDGWKVTLTTLSNERLSMGGHTGIGWQEAIEALKGVRGPDGPVTEDAGFRQRLADWYVNANALQQLSRRNLARLADGAAPGAETAIGKLLWANQTQDLASHVTELIGEYGVISDSRLAPLAGAFQRRVLEAPGLRLGGGTDEILRNIIAERILGLPPEPRVDKGIPFDALPVGR